MKKAILATKVGMTQIFNTDGTLVPVTVLQAGPCVVTQIKTEENDGYSAVQVGFVDKKDKIVNKDANGKKEIRNRHGATKAEKGHFEKAGVFSKRFVREFKFENAADYKLADEIKADIFAEGDKIDATAISKGIEDAKKNLVKVPVLNKTIPHEQEAKFGGARVFMKPAAPGTGVKAGGAMRAVFESVGIHNVLAKSKGSSNPHNLVKATVAALVEMRDAYTVAGLRGIPMSRVFKG